MAIVAPDLSRPAACPLLPSAVPERRTNSVALLTLGLGIAISTVLCLYLTRGTSLGADEYWFFVVNRGFQLEGLLSPHAGNLIFVVRLLYAIVFALFGPDYLVLRILEVLGVAAAAVLFFLLARRRVGPIPALAMTLPLLFLGATAEVTLSPNGINIVYAVSFGLGALLALEDETRRGDMLACALLTLALATFSVGIAFVAAALVSVMTEPKRRRRAFIFLVPLVFYAAWKFGAPKYSGPGYLTSAPVQLANIGLIPAFVARTAAAASAAVTGLYYPFGSPQVGGLGRLEHYEIGYLLIGVGAVALLVRARHGGVRRTVWPFIALALAFWASIVMVLAINRFPNSTRYLYAGAIALMLVAAEGLRGIRWRGPAVLAVLVASAVSIAFNVAELGTFSSSLRFGGGVERAAETGMELAAGHVRANLLPPRLSDLAGLINVGGGVRAYLRAVHQWGSPAYSSQQLRGASIADREVADLTQISAERLGLRPAVHSGHGCPRLPADKSDVRPLTVRAPGVVLTSARGGRVRLGRFAPPSVVVGTLTPRRPSMLALPADRSPQLWTVMLPPGSVTLCRI